MLVWSRFESWLAAVVSVLLVAGALGNWWLDRQWGRSGLGPRVIEPLEAAAPLGGELRAQASPGSGGGHGSAAAVEADPAEIESSGGSPDTDPSRAGCPPAAGSEQDQVVGELDPRIDINRAQPSELERLPGIGPALARRIVEYREAWGPFTDISDILEVPGIGPGKFNAIRDLIRVE